MSISEHNKNRLEQGCKELGLTLSSEQMSRLIHYLQSLYKWNRAYNLTAIRDVDEMVVKHLLDSLALVPHVTGCHILDVGTGPGLPGVPGAICDANKNWTLIDSNGKKTRFLLQIKAEMKLENVTVVKGRVEAITANQQFDVVTSRAFTALDNFVSMCLPLLNESGEMLAMKGQVPAQEIAILEQKGLDIEIRQLNVPYLHEERHLIVVKRKQ